LRKNAASLKTLNVNCRNTINIAKYVQKLLPDVEVGSGKIDGPMQRIFTYSNKKQAISCLKQAIKFLKKEDVELSDIVVISPLTSSQSALNDWIKGISDGEKVVLDGISLDYHTASSFKGLESDGVILVDATLDSSWAEAVTYVAMTRARYGLAAIVEDSKMKAFNERNIAWLEKRDTLI
jgi:DNA helicase IV